jgi:hypothetical protein
MENKISSAPFFLTVSNAEQKRQEKELVEKE